MRGTRWQLLGVAMPTPTTAAVYRHVPSTKYLESEGGGGGGEAAAGGGI